MKKNKKELVRVQTMLESDRLSTIDNFLELLTVDVTKLLKEFFDFKGDADVLIDKKGAVYEVGFKIIASRIKSFDCVPNN